jgi:hypothetical protein
MNCNYRKIIFLPLTILRSQSRQRSYVVKMPVCEYNVGGEKFELVKKADYAAAFIAWVNNYTGAGKLSIAGLIVQRTYPAVGGNTPNC